MVMLAAACILLGVDGIQGLGVLDAYAINYGGTVLRAGETIDVVASEDSKTEVLFCYYYSDAEDYLRTFNGDLIAISLGSSYTFSANGTCTAPDMNGVVDWVIVDTSNVSSGDYKSLIVFAAEIPTQYTFHSTMSWYNDPDYVIEGKHTVNSSGSQGIEITLPGEDVFDRHEGYRLDGWTADGTDYELGDTIDAPEHVMTFESSWERITELDVTYRPNGGTGSELSQHKEIHRSDGVSIYLLDSADYSKPGYKLVGWELIEEDRNKVFGQYEYDLGELCTAWGGSHQTLTFDAIWERLPEVDLDIQYKPNGGTGDVVTQSKKVDLSEDLSGQLTLLDKADFKKSGYTLSGWSDGNKTYKLGDTYKFTVEEDELSKSIAFDAVWTEKTKGTVDISIKKPAYVGAEIKYDIEKNSKGDVKVEYKKKDAKDGDYSKDAPTEPGKYTVRATLEETDEYTSAEDTADFELVYLDAPESPFTYTEVKNSAGTVTDLIVVPTSGYSIGISGSAKDTFVEEVLYSAAKEAGGVYLKRETDKAITEQVQLTPYTVNDKATVSVTPDKASSGKIYYGTKFSVAISSLSPAEIKITYKQAGAADSTYTTTEPTEPGKYTVRITAPAEGFYAAVDETTNFTIEYLEAPSAPATLSGTEGDGGWFTSDVEIEAPSGYLISTSPDGTFGKSVKWNENLQTVYYMRESDKAKTDAVKLSLDVKIDKKDPKISFESSLGLNDPKDGEKIFSDSLTFTLLDDNLKSVTVNGKKYDVSDGKCTVLLTSGITAEQKKIVAKDEAGNTYTLIIELVPAWMETNTIPLNREIVLTMNTRYTLESGSKWIMDGDATVYEGGNVFYVKIARSCTFNTKSN